MEDAQRRQELLDNLNVEFRFSVNCIAKHIGAAKCNCWMCRLARKESTDDTTNELAYQEARKFRKNSL